MTTSYKIRLDRGACDGIFACLVRDDRFAEADDGLATIDVDGITRDGEVLIATLEDDQIETARQAAAACPVDAITVTPTADLDQHSTAQPTEVSDD
ncbi:ferredoxin [Halovenus sp. WSH3]|uniref:Ferredoxin n=1 Tax=Halovenus carboxidivorans TaxID=2692199 RepID=A0A6B0T466_9EURY|nr:ferredoxin [Halovenus carboxidivorans]MXR50001.1 ferredoxin [Halovenus carboxidivorans]